jgi:hypothetical protein
MRKYCLTFLSVLLIFGLGIGTATAKKDKNPPRCGELGECVDALDCESNNPGIALHPCEQWSCNVDECCEVDTTGCPACYGDFEARVLGGGPGSKKVDRQVAVYFLVFQSAGIVDSTVDSITVCEPTILTGTVYDGQGPNPSTITYNGVPLNVDAGGVFVLDVGAGGTLYLDNLDNGGRDIDQIIINTTTVSP